MVVVVPLGPFIQLTTSPSVLFGVTFLPSTCVTISQALIPAFSAGESTTGLTISNIPGSFISTYAPIHSNSPLSQLKKSVLSTEGK